MRLNLHHKKLSEDRGENDLGRAEAGGKEVHKRKISEDEAQAQCQQKDVGDIDEAKTENIGGFERVGFPGAQGLGAKNKVQGHPRADKV